MGYEAGLEELERRGGWADHEEFVPNAQLGPPLEQQATAIMQRNPEGTFDWLYAGFDFMMSSLVRAADRAGRTELKGISLTATRRTSPSSATATSRSPRLATRSTGLAGPRSIRSTASSRTSHWPGRSIRFKLITKDNLPKGDTYIGDYDFETKYRELWGLN